MLKRKVLHLRSSRSLAGPERHLLELLPGLAERGYAVEVALLYRRRPGDPREHPVLEELVEAGIPAFQVDDADRAGVAAGRALADRLGGGDVAALHGHDPKSDWVISRSPAARRAARQGSGEPPLRRLATLHLYTRETLPLRLYRRLDLALVRRFDGVVAVHPALAAELTSAAARFARSTPLTRPRVPWRVIPNGIDGARLRARAVAALPALRRELASLAEGRRAPVLVAAGRLVRQKGFDLLLEALPAVLTVHPGLLLYVAGEGPERAALLAQSVRLGLSDRVQFLGVRADLAALAAAADGVVLPSRHEGSSYALLEAIALGVPIVATAVGDAVETLGGETGALVPPGDVGALREALLRVIHSPAEARQCAARRMARLASLRSAARMADDTAAFYAEILG